jgi:thioredoxin-related protein
MTTFNILNAFEINIEDYKDMDAAKSYLSVMETNLMNYSEEDKLNFLAYLSEIIVFLNCGKLKRDTIDREKVKYLFHWHFHYVYTNPQTYAAFWGNIGGDRERTSASWSDDLKFAEECKKYIIDNKISNH